MSSNLSYTKDHEICLKKKTVVSDCININVRSSTKCKISEYLVTNIGNIAIPIYNNNAKDI